MFAKKIKGFLKKDKITRAYIEGPTFKLLKNRFKNSVELEYKLEQCYLAMTNKIDWKNPEGNIFYPDLSKPLPLEGPLEKKYALSLSKVKVATYEEEDIEEMVPYIWSSSIHRRPSAHDFYSKIKIISMQRILVDKRFGYKYLKEIVVKRAAMKEYMFTEAGFPRRIVIKTRVEDA
nr:hypothetical protein [Tanacetum cinerariifolium]